MHNSKILSICIPTYKRRVVLEQCLESILIQCQDKQIDRSIEIVILNDNPGDETSHYVKGLMKKHPNIRYIENKVRAGIIRGILQVPTYATGEYIWFFSDDDIQTIDAIATVLQAIKSAKPDTFLCNSNQFVDKPANITVTNCLNIEKDIIVKSKKAFFAKIEAKFPYAIDWYLYAFSSTIMRKKLFDDNRHVIDDQNEYSAMSFPHSNLIYYKAEDYTQYIGAKPIVLARMQNISWATKSKIETAVLFDQSQTRFYKNLFRLYKGKLSNRFIFSAYMKALLRKLGILSIVIMTTFKINSTLYSNFFAFFKRIFFK